MGTSITQSCRIARILKPVICIAVIILSGSCMTGKKEQKPVLPKSDSVTAVISHYIDVSKKARFIPPDSTIAILKKAGRLADENRDIRQKAQICGLIAASNIRKGDTAQCAHYLDSAFRLSKKINDGELLCSLYNISANMYQYSSNYAKAAGQYYKALEAVRKYHIDSSSVLPSLYNNMGALMTLLNEEESSLKYLLLAKHHVLKVKPVDSTYLTYVLFNLGQNYAESDSSLSIRYFKESYLLAKQQKDIFFSYRILTNLIRLYLQQKQYDSAAIYLNSLGQYAVTDPAISEMEVLKGFLALYTSRADDALQDFNVALKITAAGGLNNLSEIYAGLAQTYKAKKEYAKAFDYLEKYTDMSEIQGADEKKIVVDFMLNYQMMEQEKRAAQQKMEIALKEKGIEKRNVWMGILSCILLLLIVVVLMAFRNYRNHKKLLNERVQTLGQRLEIERLKSEIDGADKERTRIAYDLHDGVMIRFTNAKMNLNKLSSSFSENETGKGFEHVIKQLETAMAELRNTAHNLMPEILLEDGISHAIYYFCRSVEETSDIKVKYLQIGEPVPRLQVGVEIVIYRIVQELLQNVIRHSKASSALVQLQFSDNFCCITIEDNGAGLIKQSSEGYGLKSIRNRVRVLNGTFYIEGQAAAGTTAYMEFDVRPYLVAA